MTQSLHIATPQISSAPLTKILGRRVYLKLEFLQPSGSFKTRGIGRLCQEYHSEGKTTLISSSGGNAGLAVAYSGSQLKIPVHVVVPQSTSPLMRDKIKAAGAKVTVHGESWAEADKLARDLSLSPQAGYVPPFDHPLIWDGNSTVVQEIKGSGFKPEAILLSVGGGGLYCGVVRGLIATGWADVPVITAETEGAASFYRSVKEGKQVTLDGITTVATSLGAKRIADQAFQFSKSHPTFAEIVTDAQSISACHRFLDDHQILVEPACGATLALLYEKRPILNQFNSILAIVCGGSNVSLELLNQWTEVFRA